ncbi:hypothetical protein N0V83_006807 [Neocucurbitaria cava]|uniref:NAD(P)-binding protein n=1 Tax=Neocucurbitaria cava TaxID=798079 RepID=A0A9W8Y6Q5_9PLEO|nr:hypothetical protein N0V83_006807 [Neocucurbitaria cava]
MHLLPPSRQLLRTSTALAKASIRPRVVYRPAPPSPLSILPLQRLRRQHAASAANMTSRVAERLKGKTIVITGASSGIGKATALEFARTQPDDLKLILTARREDALKEVAREIEGFAKGVKVLSVKLDVSKVEEIEGFVGVAGGVSGWMCLLITRLVKGVAQAPDISPADISTMFTTNVTGLIAMTQAILPIFKSRATPSGDIINIGSIAGREPYQGGSIYCATKAAVRSFTDALRKELIATRIRVIEIDPGQVETEFSVVRFGGDKEKAKKVYEGVEALTGEDIAEVVVFAAGRRENVVLADTLVFPNHQAAATVMHRKTAGQ